MQKIKSDLAHFYTENAKKYYQTRQKHWTDGQYFLDYIKSLNLEKPRILELGCGGGRFLSYLKEHWSWDFEYHGVDLSEGLLAYASKDHPEAVFSCEDMSVFMQNAGQEEYDVIVACASFQHLPSVEERKNLLKNCYKSLKYDGILLMTNWSLSSWFLKTYRKQVARSILMRIFSIGKKDWRDIYVPWEQGEKTEFRFYHLFALVELKELLLTSGFVVEELLFLDKKGEKIADRRKSNNSFFCAKKTVFIG